MTTRRGRRIAEVAKLTGLPSTTVRYYEEIGLIPPPARSDSGYRLFDDRAVERLLFIARAKTFGCSLEEIGELTEAWDADAPGPATERLRIAVERKIAKLEVKLAETSAFLVDLRGALATLTGDGRGGGAGDV